MKIHLLSFLIAAVCRAVVAAGFDGMTCDTDMAKVLKGRHLPNGPAEASESTRKILELKDLGGDELDWGSQAWWKICGTAFTVLVDGNGLVRDAMRIPTQPGVSLAFAGQCKGGPKDREVIAVVEDKVGVADLPAKAAWMIDDAKKRFVSVPVDGMLCPRGDGLVDSWK